LNRAGVFLSEIDQRKQFTEAAMPFRVSGKNIDIGEALRERVNTRIKEVVGKYFDGGFSGHVTISKDGFGFRSDCAIHLDTGVTLHVDGMAGDAYASADQTAQRIEKRLRRYNGRLKQHPSRRNASGASPDEMASYVIAAPDLDSETEVLDFKPAVIAESTAALRTYSVSEAVMELDMTGMPVVIFRHGATDRVNVVYRRSDGNIGWIDPAGKAAGK
jgi:ribosomal subunit interface protein